MLDPKSEAQTGWAGASLFLLALLLWVLNYPLITFDHHDSRVYGILALHWLTPEAYARDPFFMFGSQDSYSFFSPIYGTLIEWLGLRVAASVVLLCGAALSCIAAIRLAFACIPQPWVAAMAVLMMAVLSLNYSPNESTFVLNENFATARSIAFPLSVWALAECVRGHAWRALSLCCVALLFHPLIGVWPLAVIFMWQLPARLGYAFLLLALLSLAALMVAELGPFARLDAEWETILRTHTHDVFVGPLNDEPGGLRWREHACQLLILLAAAWQVRAAAPAAARFYGLLALIAAVGMLVAMAASYFWPSRIVIQAQLWRSMWMVAAVQPLVLAHLLLLLMRALPLSRGGQPWLLIAVLSSLFMLREWLVLLFLAYLLVVLVARWCWPQLLPLISQARLRLAEQWWLPVLAAGLFVLALPAVWAELRLLDGSVPLAFDPLLPQLSGLLIHGGLGLGFALLAYLWFYFRRRWGLFCVLLALLMLSFSHWDMRREATRRWEADAAFGIQGSLRAAIPAGDVVLWSARLPMATWYELRTAHYASSVQAIGLVFSREKTFQLLDRVARIRAAYAYEQEGQAAQAEAVAVDGHPFEFTVPEGKGIPLLCQDPALDWIVTQAREAPLLPGGTPFFYVHARGGPGTVYLYRCRNFRAAS